MRHKYAPINLYMSLFELLLAKLNSIFWNVKSLKNTYCHNVQDCQLSRVKNWFSFKNICYFINRCCPRYDLSGYVIKSYDSIFSSNSILSPYTPQLCIKCEILIFIIIDQLIGSMRILILKNKIWQPYSKILDKAQMLLWLIGIVRCYHWTINKKISKF